RRPWRWAASSSHRGGTVYVRIELSPLAAITVRSRSTTSGAGYGSPPGPGRNVPYVTPRIQNFSLPTKRNLPATCGRGGAAPFPDVAGRRRRGATRPLTTGLAVTGTRSVRSADILLFPVTSVPSISLEPSSLAAE